MLWSLQFTLALGGMFLRQQNAVQAGDEFHPKTATGAQTEIRAIKISVTLPDLPFDDLEHNLEAEDEIRKIVADSVEAELPADAGAPGPAAPTDASAAFAPAAAPAAPATPATDAADPAAPATDAAAPAAPATDAAAPAAPATDAAAPAAPATDAAAPATPATEAAAPPAPAADAAASAVPATDAAAPAAPATDAAAPAAPATDAAAPAVPATDAATSAAFIDFTAPAAPPAPPAAPPAAPPDAPPAPPAKPSVSVVLRKGRHGATQMDITVLGVSEEAEAKTQAKLPELEGKLQTSLKAAKLVDWHGTPQIKGVKVEDEKVTLFVPACAPHIAKIIKSFSRAYTRLRVPTALENECHTYVSRLTFNKQGSNFVNEKDLEACREATKKLMQTWQGNQGGKEYETWCRDICHSRFGESPICA
eukprot:GEMP01052175.1.p1 GENE.GEMP01052175.1~~GEMP01052175.1.p1  ORF type:complete len:421 (+),score=126.65 GEMP01052175.1:65-1327(+)